jgi:hypothetical protein
LELRLGFKPFLQYTGNNAILGNWVDKRFQNLKNPKKAPK